MKLGKLLLAVVGAAVLLGAFVTSASARTLSTSSQADSLLWRRLDFAFGGEFLECEVKLSGSLHTRTIAKAAGLIGYVTEGTVLRCARWGMTINQGSLPWHRMYRSFSGTLPNITSQSETISGAEWTIREAVFGLICTVRRETSTVILSYTVSSGTITRAELSGTNNCSGIEGTLSSSETNVLDRVGGVRLTLTLI